MVKILHISVKKLDLVKMADTNSFKCKIVTYKHFKVLSVTTAAMFTEVFCLKCANFFSVSFIEKSIAGPFLFKNIVASDHSVRNNLSFVIFFFLSRL